MSRAPSKSLRGWQVLARYGQENLSVLLLGDVQGEWNIPERRYHRRHVGLLLIQSTDQGDEEDLKPLPYRRLRLCTWSTTAKWREAYINTLSLRSVELEIH